jgi:hypothetical protein
MSDPAPYLRRYLHRRPRDHGQRVQGQHSRHDDLPVHRGAQRRWQANRGKKAAAARDRDRERWFTATMIARFTVEVVVELLDWILGGGPGRRL